MLVKCKITKFWEVNYKILTQILAKLVVIAAVHKNPILAKCHWCQDRANIDHILVHCVYTKHLRRSIIGALGEVSEESWILGGAGSSYDQVIWVSNFAIYKAHLKACHGIFQEPLHLFQ